MANGGSLALTVLALDSAGSACSAALLQGGTILARAFAPMEHSHAEALIPMVQKVMATAELDYGDLDLIAVGTGPGSYTGVRVGLAAAQAIASAAAKPITGVSNFDVLFAACTPEAPNLVALDTRRADLYVQLFKTTGEIDSPPAIVTEDAVPALFSPNETILVAGDAAPRAVELLRTAGRSARTHPSAHHADAAIIARIAAERWMAEARPRPVQPIYLRPPDARTVAERDAAKNQQTRRAPASLIVAGPTHGAVMAALQNRCFDERWSSDSVTALLAQPGVAGVLLIADDSQIPMGYGLLRCVADEAEILTFGIDPRYRRAGHGRRVLDDMIAQARAAGARMVFLEVAEGNGAARALYEASGFKTVGRREGYYRGPRGSEAGLTYRLDLAASSRSPNLS
jgi:tRNA threonylcarbamoyladenosine biosynthesis protein TsaB